MEVHMENMEFPQYSYLQASDFALVSAVSIATLKNRLDFWGLPRKSFTSVHLTDIVLTSSISGVSVGTGCSLPTEVGPWLQLCTEAPRFSHHHQG